MAPKKKKTQSRSRSEKDTESSKDSSLGIPPLKLKQETRYTIYAIFAFVAAIFFILAAFKSGGIAGHFFYHIFHDVLFGIGYILLPVVLILLGISFSRTNRPSIGALHLISAGLFLFSSLGIIDIIAGNQSAGFIGEAASYPFRQLLDTKTAIIFLFAIFLISVLILFDTKPNFTALWVFIKGIFKRKNSEEENEEHEEDESLADSEIKIPVVAAAVPGIAEAETVSKRNLRKEIKETLEEEVFVPSAGVYKPHSAYVPPPINLLEGDRGKPNVGDIKSNANTIKRTLQNFGILVEMDEITIGPTVTRYALKPAEGVKLSRIVGLQNDLALALAARTVRIEAPIPGKSLVGIEVPNKIKSTVGLGSLLSDPTFRENLKPLLVALGRGLSGKSSFGNLAKMPHLLIAGTTGSGKSVTIHSIITSLLYRNGPDDMRFIMIDPKRVELTLYNKIPHLLTPVITDPKKAILALKWAAKEMDRRYDILESEAVRDIESYHNNIVKPFTDKKIKKDAKDAKAAANASTANSSDVADGAVTGAVAGATTVDDAKKVEEMPYIVIIIDELADIMQTYPRELESAIVRLAQMSRAVGIHLILSTQRPSVNVITGLIKANVPARLALQVSSQIDSRTILDTGGAEKLLGAGDMLFLSGELSQPERIQSAYIGEEEVKKVVKYLAEAYKDEVIGDIELSSGSISPDKSIFESTLDEDNRDNDDELYEDARVIVIEAGKGSTSFLQRKLKVGYSRAARLIDLLEERGVVGPPDGSKPREVFEKSMTAERSQLE